LVVGLNWEITTVQAPQPPSPQPLRKGHVSNNYHGQEAVFCSTGTNTQFGAGEANSSKIFEKGDLGVDVVQNDLGSVQVESEGIIIIGCERLEGPRVPLWRDGDGCHAGL
jgi:hypothetical protein